MKYTNITISAPVGTSQHGHQHLLCFPTRWTTVLTFLVANYIAHIFTIWKRPGEKTSEYLFACFLALLFPVSGLGRGMDAIYRHAAWRKSPVQLFKGLLGFGGTEYEHLKATKTGALGVLYRKRAQKGDLERSTGREKFEYNDRDWDLPGAVLRGCRKPATGNNGVSKSYEGSQHDNEATVIKIASYGDNPEDLLFDRNIAGCFSLRGKKGTKENSSSYGIMELPLTSVSNIRIQDVARRSHTDSELTLPQSSSVAPVFFALVQVIYAMYSLVRNAGDQFQRYGFSSFSLSVIPYISMSIINLFGNLLTPTYTAITLVQTSVLREAVSRGSIISGTVGEILDEDLYQGIDGTLQNEAQEFRVSPNSYTIISPPLNNLSLEEALPQQHSHKTSEISPSDPASLERAISRCSSHSTAPNTPPNTAPDLRICFLKTCPHQHPYILTIPSGQPPLYQPPRSREGIVKLLGLILAILPSILCMILIPPSSQRASASPRRQGIIIAWTVVDVLFGMYVLWSRTSFLESFTDLKFAGKVFWRGLFGEGERTKEKKKKDREYLGGRWVWIGLFWVCLGGGLVVAALYFWVVVGELLEFGDCRVMSG